MTGTGRCSAKTAFSLLLLGACLLSPPLALADHVAAEGADTHPHLETTPTPQGGEHVGTPQPPAITTTSSPPLLAALQASLNTSESTIDHTSMNGSMNNVGNTVMKTNQDVDESTKAYDDEGSENTTESNEQIAEAEENTTSSIDNTPDDELMDDLPVYTFLRKPRLVNNPAMLHDGDHDTITVIQSTDNPIVMEDDMAATVATINLKDWAMGSDVDTQYDTTEKEMPGLVGDMLNDTGITDVGGKTSMGDMMDMMGNNDTDPADVKKAAVVPVEEMLDTTMVDSNDSDVHMGRAHKFNSSTNYVEGMSKEDAVNVQVESNSREFADMNVKMSASDSGKMGDDEMKPSSHMKTNSNLMNGVHIRTLSEKDMKTVDEALKMENIKEMKDVANATTSLLDKDMKPMDVTLKMENKMGMKDTTNVISHSEKYLKTMDEMPNIETNDATNAMSPLKKDMKKMDEMTKMDSNMDMKDSNVMSPSEQHTRTKDEMRKMDSNMDKKDSNVMLPSKKDTMTKDGITKMKRNMDMNDSNVMSLSEKDPKTMDEMPKMVNNLETNDTSAMSHSEKDTIIRDEITKMENKVKSSSNNSEITTKEPLEVTASDMNIIGEDRADVGKITTDSEQEMEMNYTSNKTSDIVGSDVELKVDIDESPEDHIKKIETTRSSDMEKDNKFSNKTIEESWQMKTADEKNAVEVINANIEMNSTNDTTDIEKEVDQIMDTSTEENLLEMSEEEDMKMEGSERVETVEENFDRVPDDSSLSRRNSQSEPFKVQALEKKTSSVQTIEEIESFVHELQKGFKWGPGYIPIPINGSDNNNTDTSKAYSDTEVVFDLPKFTTAALTSEGSRSVNLVADDKPTAQTVEMMIKNVDKVQMVSKQLQRQVGILKTLMDNITNKIREVNHDMPYFISNTQKLAKSSSDLEKLTSNMNEIKEALRTTNDHSIASSMKIQDDSTASREARSGNLVASVNEAREPVVLMAHRGPLPVSSDSDVISAALREAGKGIKDTSSPVYVMLGPLHLKQ